MFNKIRNIPPKAAYKINLWIYIFHVLVGVGTLFYMKFEPDVLNRVATWGEAISWLWTTIFAPEFYFYILMVVLIVKKKRPVKYLIKANMVVILIFIFIGTFVGYSMQLSYFMFFWVGLLKLTSAPMYTPLYFVVMGSIWLFYLFNLLFWVDRIEWE